MAHHEHDHAPHRRDVLKRTLAAAMAPGLLIGGAARAADAPPASGNAAAPAAAQGAGVSASAALPASDRRILVVLELSGGNDGLNTVVPHGDDAYYRLRPTLGIRPQRVRRIDERYGFHPAMAGFERLYKDGRMAIVHGCGYAQPSFSHFTSMAWWHTAAPNGGEPYGWMGRLADAMDPSATPGLLVDVDEQPSLAVRARRHLPVTFDDPAKFYRKGRREQRAVLDQAAVPTGQENDSARFLLEVAAGAQRSATRVREAWQRYRTPVDYGVVPLDLPKIAAMIAADLPTRLYYTAYRHNAFDTHVQQPDLHNRLLTYTADTVSAFMRDLERIGRADDVVLMIFSEFGRRAGENANLGTDHGTANHMYLVGKPVRGGHYGQAPSLDTLDEGGNLIHTTDFRRVYATAMQGWLGVQAGSVLKGGTFDPFPVFG